MRLDISPIGTKSNHAPTNSLGPGPEEHRGLDPGTERQAYGLAYETTDPTPNPALDLDLEGA